MSIEQLREMRRQGQRPMYVTLILGRPNKSFDDGPDKVVVTRSDLDFSPLVGMPIQIIDVASDVELASQVLDRLEPLRVQLVGVYAAYGALAYCQEYEYAMRRYWEELCPTE